MPLASYPRGSLSVTRTRVPGNLIYVMVCPSLYVIGHRYPGEGLFCVFERVMGSFVSGFCLLFPRFFTFDQNRPQTTVYCLLESVWNLPAANMASKFHHDEECHRYILTSSYFA